MPKVDPYLRHEQRAFDLAAFDRVYASLTERWDKVRHVGEHIGKAAAKLGDLDVAISESDGEERFEALESKVVKEAIPDLLIYRTQLSNTIRIDLEGAIRRYWTIPPQTLTAARLMVADARFAIDGCVEPQEHGSQATLSQRDVIEQLVIPNLHNAAVGLADQFNIPDLTQAHAQRLAFLLNEHQRSVAS